MDKRWCLEEGEEARLTSDGPAAAEITSQGFLPLRVREEGITHLRPAFPGTAVALGERTFEVREEIESESGVVYRLEPWPHDHVVRDRVVYGPRFVRAAQADRRRAQTRQRVRPFAWLFYPIVGLLPETPQELLCERLGLYAVTASLTSGAGEALIGIFCLFAPWGPGIVLLMGGLGRAFEALAFRETSGFWPLVLLADAAAAVRPHLQRRDQTIVPLTREAFWARLRLPDRIQREADGSSLVRGALPHLTWRAGHRLQIGGHYWLVEPLPPALHRARLVYSYRLILLTEGREPGAPAASKPGPTAYVDEVRAEVSREWDDLRQGFGWLVSLLPARVQERALSHRGGAADIRSCTVATALVSMGFASYLLYLQPVAHAEGLGPLAAVVGAALLLEGGWRLLRAWQSRYAPSLWGLVLPGDSLRPERIAYHAHRDAEREALRGQLQIAR